MNQTWKIVCFFFLIVAVFFSFELKLAIIEGFQDSIFDLLLNGGDTVYASGYSDFGFLAIKPGMTEGEVKRILGPPLDAYKLDYISGCDTGMRWTKSAHDSNYRVRTIMFKKGVVIEKNAEFYLD